MLCDSERELFHSVVAKDLFVGCRSRPDIVPTISVLSSRLREPSKDDWRKCGRLVKHLKCIDNLHLILHYDGLAITRWHVDASYTVHPNFRSHSGGVLKILDTVEGIASGSTKQKLNVHSSTMAELVAVDDFLEKVLWVRKFMENQGISMDTTILEDNGSSILLCTKGRRSLGKHNKATNVHFFA